MPATACECGEAPIHERLGSSSAVFAGTLSTTSKVNIANRQMTFEVSEIWKGPIQNQITVESNMWSASCGWNAEPGVMYVIYANQKDDGKFRTGSCSGNEKLEESTIRTAVGDGTIPPQSVSPSQTPPQNVVPSKQPPSVVPSAVVTNPTATNTNAEPKIVTTTSSMSLENKPVTPEITPTVESQKSTSFISWIVTGIRTFFSIWFTI